MTPVEERDPNAIYHKMRRAQLDTLTPGLDWKEYFTPLGVPGVSDVNVGQLKFFKEVGAMLKDVPLSDLKTYLRWHLAAAEAPRLSAAFVREDFRFNGSIIRGTKELQP